MKRNTPESFWPMAQWLTGLTLEVDGQRSTVSSAHKSKRSSEEQERQDLSGKGRQEFGRMIWRSILDGELSNTVSKIWFLVTKTAPLSVALIVGSWFLPGVVVGAVSISNPVVGAV